MGLQQPCQGEQTLRGAACFTSGTALSPQPRLGHRELLREKTGTGCAYSDSIPNTKFCGTHCLRVLQYQAEPLIPMLTHVLQYLSEFNIT